MERSIKDIHKMNKKQKMAYESLIKGAKQMSLFDYDEFWVYRDNQKEVATHREPNELLQDL